MRRTVFTSKSIWLLLIVLLMVISTTGCVRRQGPLERAGETADEAVEDAGDAAEDLGDAIEDAVD